jgi:hypothetical protein
MQPIVNGLEEQYAAEVEFISLNSEDGDQGEAAFAAYGLRGHPSIVLVRPGGQISAIKLGVVTAKELEQAIQTALGS